jgi:hypothetical protein
MAKEKRTEKLRKLCLSKRLDVRVILHWVVAVRRLAADTGLWQTGFPCRRHGTCLFV